MDRIEFCKLLNNAKLTSGQKMKDVCFALGLMPIGIYRLERGSHNFNVKKAIDYLGAVGYTIVLSNNNDDFIMCEYSLFVDWLKNARKDKFTQRSLAQKIGYTHVAIANVETFKSVISIDVFLQVIEALGYELKIVPK